MKIFEEKIRRMNEKRTDTDLCKFFIYKSLFTQSLSEFTTVSQINLKDNSITLTIGWLLRETTLKRSKIFNNAEDVCVFTVNQNFSIRRLLYLKKPKEIMPNLCLIENGTDDEKTCQSRIVIHFMFQSLKCNSVVRNFWFYYERTIQIVDWK